MELAIDPIVRRFGGIVRNGKWFVWLGLGDFWLTGAPRVGSRAPFDRPYGTGANFGVDSPECASFLLHANAQGPSVGGLGSGAIFGHPYGMAKTKPVPKSVLSPKFLA